MMEHTHNTHANLGKNKLTIGFVHLCEYLWMSP